LAELLGKVPDLEAELARAARPKVLVKALVGYGDRQMAKDHGFHWNNPVPNAWAKRMPLEDAEELPFEVVEIVVG
jgi:DNA polymerase-3 subunit epsilon